MQKTNAKDARNDYRHRTNDYFLVIDRRTGEVIGRLLDISLAGFKMVTHVPLVVNLPLECQLSFPRSIGNIRELPFEGTVRWCVHNIEMDCYEIGCQLHEVSKIFRATLAQVLLEFEGK